MRSGVHIPLRREFWAQFPSRSLWTVCRVLQWFQVEVEVGARKNLVESWKLDILCSCDKTTNKVIFGELGLEALQLK
eukprot:Awhi_evm1s5230